MSTLKGPLIKVRVEVEKVLKQLPQAVQVPHLLPFLPFHNNSKQLQVVFANQQCLACGQRGDPRLMEDKVSKDKNVDEQG